MRDGGLVSASSPLAFDNGPTNRLFSRTRNHSLAAPDVANERSLTHSAQSAAMIAAPHWAHISARHGRRICAPTTRDKATPPAKMVKSGLLTNRVRVVAQLCCPPVIRSFLVVKVPNASNMRHVPILLRPRDRFLLRLERGEYVSGVIIGAGLQPFAFAFARAFAPPTDLRRRIWIKVSSPG